MISKTAEYVTPHTMSTTPRGSYASGDEATQSDML